MPVSFDRDWGRAKRDKQEGTNKGNAREDSKRVNDVYKGGDKVTLGETGTIPKLSLPRLGPYEVISHHSNGTVTTQLGPHATGRVNARRPRPHYTKGG